MTIICYRDGILASDSWVIIEDSYSIFGNTKKILKTKKGTLVGATGSIQSTTEFLRWAKKDPITDPPESIFEDDFTALMIKPNGTVWLWERKVPVEITAPYFAIGAGFQIAMGAFFMGASAPKAVAAAIEHCKVCGGEIQTESL